jgi:hypothetical protein
MGAVTGPDVFFDPAASPYALVGLEWAPPEGRNNIHLCALLGSGRFNEQEQFHNPNILDGVWVHTLNSRLTYTLEGLFGWETNVPEIGTATWFGVVQYLTHQITPRLNGTTRLEFFDDIDGSRTGFKGLYTALTAGLNFRPCPELTFRPELRFDYNGESAPFEGKHGLFTAELDVILHW